MPGGRTFRSKERGTKRISSFLKNRAATPFQAESMWYNTRMNKRIIALRAGGAACLAIAAAAMVWQLYSIYFMGMRHVAMGLLYIVMAGAPLALGVVLIARSFAAEAARRRTVRLALFALFGFYLAALAGALIVSRLDLARFDEAAAYYRAHLDLMTNFIPFETVLLYIRAIEHNYIGMEIPLSNLVGNMLLFMPMAVFLPCLFRPMRKFWLFLLVMAFVLAAIEGLQFLLSCGSCDVDDVFLNLIGTTLVYAVLKIPAVRRLLEKLYLLPREEAVLPPAPEENAA